MCREVSDSPQESRDVDAAMEPDDMLDGKLTAFEMIGTNLEGCDDDIERLQAHVFRRRIRMKPLFATYDHLHSGKISKYEFGRVLAQIFAPNALNDAETPIDTDALAVHFADARVGKNDPRSVNYLKFCEVIDQVFGVTGLEKDPTIEVATPGTMVLDAGGFITRPVRDEAGVLRVLTKIAQLSEQRAIDLHTCFNTHTRAPVDVRCGRIEPADFIRNFPLAVSTPTKEAAISDADMKLLVERYSDDNGFVRLFAFENDVAELVAQARGKTPEDQRQHVQVNRSRKGQSLKYTPGFPLQPPPERQRPQSAGSNNLRKLQQHVGQPPLTPSTMFSWRPTSAGSFRSSENPTEQASPLNAMVPSRPQSARPAQGRFEQASLHSTPTNAMARSRPQSARPSQSHRESFEQTSLHIAPTQMPRRPQTAGAARRPQQNSEQVSLQNASGSRRPQSARAAYGHRGSHELYWEAIRRPSVEPNTSGDVFGLERPQTARQVVDDIIQEKCDETSSLRVAATEHQPSIDSDLSPQDGYEQAERERLEHPSSHDEACFETAGAPQRPPSARIAEHHQDSCNASNASGPQKPPKPPSFTDTGRRSFKESFKDGLPTCRQFAHEIPTATTVMAKLTNICSQRRLRLYDIFKAGDTLRKGKITRVKMNAALAVLGIHFHPEEYEILFEEFVDDDGLFCYTGCAAIVEESISKSKESPGSTLASWAGGNGAAAVRKIMEQGGQEPSSVSDATDRRSLEYIETFIAKRTHSRRLEMFPVFDDLSHTRWSIPSHVTQGQFIKAMKSFNFGLTDNDFVTLMEKYCDDENATEFNYILFCRSIDKRMASLNQTIVKRDISSKRKQEFPSRRVSVGENPYFDNLGEVKPIGGRRNLARTRVVEYGSSLRPAGWRRGAIGGNANYISHHWM